jgi:hypothetical protein
MGYKRKETLVVRSEKLVLVGKVYNRNIRDRMLRINIGNDPGKLYYLSLLCLSLTKKRQEKKDYQTTNSNVHFKN